MRTIAAASMLMAIGVVATGYPIDGPEQAHTPMPGTATGYVISEVLSIRTICSRKPPASGSE